MKRIVCILVVISVWCNFASAQQDAMYSQYMFNMLAINPAYAGSQEALSTTMLMRRQWIGFAGSPTTITLSSHMPVKADMVNLGLNISHDRIGASQNTSLFASYAYRMDLDAGKLAFGISPGFNMFKMKWSQINPVDPTDVSFLSDSKTLVLPNAGLGAYFEHDLFYVGLSVPRILSNRLDFTKSKGTLSSARLRNHYYLTGGSEIEVSRNIKLQPSMLLKFVKNAPLELDLNFGALFHDAVSLAVSYRTGDALIFLAQYNVNEQLKIGYSYDFTYSKLATQNSGTHEIMIRYNYAVSKTFRSKY